MKPSVPVKLETFKVMVLEKRLCCSGKFCDARELDMLNLRSGSGNKCMSSWEGVSVVDCWSKSWVGFMDLKHL